MGVGPCESALQQLSRELGISAHIRQAEDAELTALYARADLFVHASAVELEGMSVLEAMASGNTVVVSDSVDSEASQFINYPKGRFAAGDVEDLCQNLEFWLDHADERTRQGAENRRTARNFHLDRSTERLISIYEGVLGDLEIEQPASGVGR